MRLTTLMARSDALEDPRAEVARSCCLVVSRIREHQDTDADHDCRVEQHQRGAGDEQRGGVATFRTDDARRDEAADAVCQVARKEKDPNDSGGPPHAGVRVNDWREVESLEACVGSTRKMAMVSHPVRKCNVVRRKGSYPAAASGVMTTTASDTTPDTAAFNRSRVTGIGPKADRSFARSGRRR